ncbi:hypothetical protein BDQ94DRAFT_150168 [Aspergillus welwitschiae]|uniref:Uncharacterized protein n=1 Tax=Aspergillus welwitschiae TaxID=1341132 RepID=A0A3F3PS12_9EURO|nr:hypothetical protein BDQ94DRAFT_150168 [Aspergillus welwitschiae]RDH29653.1 hypothetical protein BDQ94DRAFT_150168 [Aspergillus welwitschiae]
MKSAYIRKRSMPRRGYYGYYCCIMKLSCCAHFIYCCRQIDSNKTTHQSRPDQ